MVLTFKDVIQQGIFNDLVKYIGSGTNARILLNRIGFPSEYISGNTDSLEFWNQICNQIDSGFTSFGFEELLSAAARIYPLNRIFAPYATNAGNNLAAFTTSSDSNAYVTLIVSGKENALEILQDVRSLAQKLNQPPESVSLSFANAQGIFLRLEGWSLKQAYRLRSELKQAEQTYNVETEITVAEGWFDDYLIGQLFVEGPDQARFEITDIPASTTVAALAQGVIDTQYDRRVFGSVQGRHKRTVAVDMVTEDNSNRRLTPTQSLYEAGILEGSTIRIYPEATAGGIELLKDYYSDVNLIHFEFTIDADYSSISNAHIELLEHRIHRATNDHKLRIIQIRPGSVVIEIISSEETYHVLIDLFQSGQLTTVLGRPVKGIRICYVLIACVATALASIKMANTAKCKPATV